MLRHRPETNSCHGGIAGLLVVLCLLASVFVGCVFFVFGKIVPPDSIGLRQNYYGLGVLEKGFSSRGLLPGLHWKLPYISEVHLIPRGIQFVRFNAGINSEGADRRPLLVKTADGADVTTDVTLITRFFQEPVTAPTSENAPTLDFESPVPLQDFSVRPHGGPRDLVLTFSQDNSRQIGKVAERAENELIGTLSRLSTTDFYDSKLREQAALDARTAIATKVEPLGVEVWATLIRRYFYEEQIDQQIFNKNLQEQTEKLNAAGALLAEEKAQTNELISHWDNEEIAVLRVDKLNEAKEIRSQGELYEAQQMAKGDLLVAEAEAAVDAAKANVFAEVPGASVYIARELVPLLVTLKGGVVTNIDPFDLNSWIKKFVGS